MKRPLAVISGAGVAGLAAAWWLDRAGWRTIVIERSSSVRERGYMIGLSGLGFETAGRMGLHDKLRSVSYEINENVYKDSKGRELLRLRYRDFLRDLPYLAVLRSDLVRMLADILPESATLRLGESISAFDDKGDSVEVTLDSGEQIRADLLLGADGFRSTMRGRLFGAENQHLQSLGYYFAVYDINASKQFDTDFLSYAEPGHMAEYYGLHDGGLAAMHVWRDARHGLELTEDKVGLLGEVARNSHPHVRSLIDLAGKENKPIVIDSLTMVDLPKWSKGRVALIGDAAHCLTLVSGQGAGMALAAAEMLAASLKNEADIDSALLGYEAKLRPIIVRLQARSRKMAKVFIPANEITFRFRNMIMRNMPKKWLGHYLSSAIKSELKLTR